LPAPTRRAQCAVVLVPENSGAGNDAGKFARALLRQKSLLWTFLVNPGAEPTNNRAERALRFALIWRKRSLGA
jgi:hypothetical protein